MARNDTVTVNVVGDSKRLGQTFDEAEGKAKGFGKKMGSILGAVGGAAAIAGVAGFGKASAEAFAESEQSAARLQDAFEKFPALADSNAATFRRLNEQLAKKTRFDDDATASGQAVLAQFGLTGKQIEAMTPLLQDYAAKTGKDLPTAAGDLGKALLGQGRALKAIGIDFKDAGSTGANFDQLMGGLRSQVGGFAEVEGKTATGQAAILSNQFGVLQEMVGAKLVPVLTALAEKVLAVVNFLGSLSPGMQTAIGVTVGLAGAALLIVKAVQAWTAVQAALNVVLSANPIGLVVVAIAALVAGIVWAYKNVDWFRNGVQSAFGAMVSAGQWLGRVFAGIWDGIVAGFRWVTDTIKSRINWVIGLINKLIAGVNSVTGGLNRIPGVSLPTFGTIPQLAKGGIVTSPTLAMIGEAGPEAVVPLDRYNGGGGGGGITVNFNGVTTREAADQVVRILEQHFARGGSVGNQRGGTLRPA